MKTDDTTVTFSTEYIKLDSFLKLCGACGSGGEAKSAVLAGFVKINGVLCAERGKKIKNGDEITFDGVKYTAKREE